MSATLPELGSTVTIGRSRYEVERHGCATEWAECPNGEHAVTVLRDGGRMTECADARRIEVVS